MFKWHFKPVADGDFANLRRKFFGLIADSVFDLATQ